MVYETHETEGKCEVDIALVIYPVLGALAARAPIQIETHFDTFAVSVIHQCLEIGEVGSYGGCPVHIVLSAVDAETAALWTSTAIVRLEVAASPVALRSASGGMARREVHSTSQPSSMPIMS